MEKEIWKDVKGYEGIYQISNLGRIKSLDRPIYCPLTKNKKTIKKGRILKIQTNINRLFLCTLK